jgi:hypothetical protein
MPQHGLDPIDLVEAAEEAGGDDDVEEGSKVEEGASSEEVEGDKDEDSDEFVDPK